MEQLYYIGQRNIVKQRERSFCTCTSHSELTLMQYCQNIFTFSQCHVRIGGYLLSCGCTEIVRVPRWALRTGMLGKEEKGWIESGFCFQSVFSKPNAFLSLPLLPWKLLLHQQSAKLTFRRWTMIGFLKANDIFSRKCPC